MFSNGTGANQCGSSTYDDYLYYINQVAIHNSEIAIVKMSTQIYYADNNQTWGFSSFKLSVYECPTGCSYCEQNSRITCLQWELAYWEQNHDNWYYHNNYVYYFLTYSSYQRLRIQLQQHSKVKIQLRLIVPSSNYYFQVKIDEKQIFIPQLTYSSVFLSSSDSNIPIIKHDNTYIVIELISPGNQILVSSFQIFIYKEEKQDKLKIIEGCSTAVQNICLDCIDGWTFDELNDSCVPICGDSLLVGNEQCEDGNNIQDDTCHQCNYICDQNCIQCKLGKCLNCKKGYYLDKSNVCQSAKIIRRLNSDGEQIECQTGWTFSDIFQSCIPVCGDNLIVENEQCDDGNLIQNDGCYECKFSCDKNCKICDYGTCLNCFQGYELDGNSTCLAICGDGMVIPYIEECDDVNFIKGDGCYNCTLECLDDCTDCFLGICQTCGFGLILKQGQCIPVCGDKIIIAGYEECDDGNNIQYDGCYDCQYQCIQNCQICEKGICLDKCSYGEIMVNQKCFSVCGNKIITGQEECDDGNTIQYDGCYNCYFSCPLYCDDCLEGICIECLPDFNVENNTCISISTCGDGKVTDQEDCDDGNVLSNDGCSNCHVEENWVCDDSSPSVCYFSIIPTLNIKYLNQTQSFQYVQLTFSQEVRINSEIPLLQTMKISVKDVPEDSLNIIISPLLEATTTLSLPEYQIAVQISEQLNSKPILIIDLNQNVYNEHNVSSINTTTEITLNIPMFFSQTSKNSAQQFASFSQNLIYALGGISVATLITGESAVFQEILNTLQYLSLLKYINVEYPENLQIFFQASDLVSIGPLLSFIHFDTYFNFFFFSEESTIPNGKFKYYQQNPDLINNLSCQLFQFVALIIIIVIVTLLKKILYKEKYINRFFYLVSCLLLRISSKLVLKLNQALHSLLRNFSEITNLLTFTGFRTLFLINSWDLLFKTLLYLNNIQWNSLRNLIQNMISVSILIAYLIIIISVFNGENKIKKIDRQKKYNMKIEVMSLGRQLFFLFCLVFLQNNQVFQAILISFSSITYFFLLRSDDKQDFTTNVIEQLIEVTVTVFTITSFIYFNDVEAMVQQNVKFFIGWLQMGVLCIGLLAEIAKFIVTKGKIIIQYLKQSQEQNQRVSTIVTFETLSL